MRIGFVVDATCDLPDACLERHGVRILPNVLELGGRTWIDERDPDQTMLLYRRLIADRSVDGRMNASSAEEIREIFLQELVLDYDRVLVISAAAELTDVHRQATDASYGILQHYRERRDEAEQAGSFALRVLDSRSMLAGEGIVLCRALQLLEEGQLGFEKIRRAVRDELERVRCLVALADPWYLRHRGLDGQGAGLARGAYVRAMLTGRRPVLEVGGAAPRLLGQPGNFEAACALALKEARQAVERGLGTPALVLSFGGDPRLVRQMAAYQELEAAAAGARLDLHLSVMSVSAGSRLGPGALSVAWLEAA